MFFESMLEAGVRLTVPLLLVALGELIAERAGVINIGLEGKMAAGAYAGFVVMAGTGDPWMAMLAAVLAGAAVSAVMAGVAIWGQVNQILVGFALFITVPGLVAFLYQQHTTTLVVTPALDRLSLPGLSDLPVIGGAFFSQNGFYYGVVALCLLVWVWMHRTRFGLSVSACGHDPEVALSKGIAVRWVRTQATLACGALAGLGGAALTVGALGSFSPGVTGGAGSSRSPSSYWAAGASAGPCLPRSRSGSPTRSDSASVARWISRSQLLAMLPWLVVLGHVDRRRPFREDAAGARSQCRRGPVGDLTESSWPRRDPILPESRGPAGSRAAGERCVPTSWSAPACAAARIRSSCAAGAGTQATRNRPGCCMSPFSAATCRTPTSRALPSSPPAMFRVSRASSQPRTSRGWFGPSRST